MTKRAPIRQLPSQEELLALLSYDPDTGELLWRRREELSGADKRFNAKYAGRPAGSLTIGRADGTNRYLVVGLQIDGRQQ
jgi:hypothetical protein